jgi:predicted aldo/keto reductase-like oxidoreductase
MKATDYLTIGKSYLGFGAMRLPESIAETEKMVDAFLDAGYDYFDTAWIYGGSEEALKKALVKRHGRDKFFVADKMPSWEVKGAGGCENLFNEQLRRTGLDYFDFYLVHSVDDEKEQDIKDLALFEWVLEQKKKGLVRHVGFSFHGTTACLARTLEKHPEAEFVQLQLNYDDCLRGPAKEWQELAVKYNKPIIVMEPVKGGSLAVLPAPAEKLLKDYAPDRSIASWAIQYAATLHGVTCVLSGMSNMSQMQDNLKTYENLKPLTVEELKLLEAVLAEMGKVSSIPCTACKYCHANCPMEIDIAACFGLYNELKRGNSDWNRKMMYNTIPEKKRANSCTACGVCLSRCPQKINIPKKLEDVVDIF